MISLDTQYLVVRFWLQLPTSRRDTFVGSSSEVVAEDEPAEVSEEDETEEELLKEEQVQKYVLEEKLFYEDVYEEDPLDENVPLEEQSEEDVPEYGLNNLMIAKMMKFKGHYFEKKLVSFLLRKAPGLKKLLLVAPKGHIKALGKDTLEESFTRCSDNSKRNRFCCKPASPFRCVCQVLVFCQLKYSRSQLKAYPVVCIANGLNMLLAFYLCFPLRP